MATKKSAPAIAVTGDADADALLSSDPLALLIGMLLDQQVPMEWAFRGPLTLRERLGGTLDASAIAASVLCQPKRRTSRWWRCWAEAMSGRDRVSNCWP